MRVVITGGCGFLGHRIALRLLERGDLDELVLFDNAPAVLPLPEDHRLSAVTGDITDRDAVRRVIAPGTNSVFHLAAVVSGEAEADTDLGYRVNLDGTRAVLDACRALCSCPRLVFASSLAVYGGKLPEIVGEETPLTPQTSYGT
jgi:D-erythronate 2-dehydrogenase